MVSRLVGVQLTVGVVGAWLLKVITKAVLAALVPPCPSLAVAVTLTVPGVVRLYVAVVPVAPLVLPVADQVYVMVPPSPSVEPLAVQVLVALVSRLVGVQLTVGVVGIWLLKVRVTAALALLVPPCPSLAVAVTLTVPGVERLYVAVVPVAPLVRPVADQV